MPVAAAAGVTLATGLAAGWSLAVVPASVLIWLFVLFVDRRADSPGEPLGLLSPIDGRVLRVDSVEDPWLKRRATRVRIVAAFPGVGVVRAPTEGTVSGYWVAATPFDADVPARQERRSGSPNCYAVGIRTDEGDEVLFAISSPRPVSRFKLDVSPGERVGQGRRIGFVYFAGYVDLLAARNTRTAVVGGTRVHAGESVLGAMVHD